MLNHKKAIRCRTLRFEPLEERTVLSGIADIVFLVDESGSGGAIGSINMYAWLKDRIFASSAGGDNPIADALENNGFTDVRYGLIGFAGGTSGSFAHSYVVEQGGNAGEKVSGTNGT
ncbi:MAG: hypothetical protein IT424_16130 [Pirellulales bacterium]|nr:hypothetical protein [Pirellulales bacterium]